MFIFYPKEEKQKEQKLLRSQLVKNICKSGFHSDFDILLPAGVSSDVIRL